MPETIHIYRLDNGWYDFKNIPQGFVKIHGLNVGSDANAIKKAQEINPDYYYEVVDKSLEVTNDRS